jgi:hypothetical protein
MSAPSAPGRPSIERTQRALLVGTLLAFAAVAYGPVASLPFVGDDYVFLDKTRTAGFLDLWSRGNTDFGWYRPWSREFHFWLLQRTVGLNEAAYRLVGLTLWVAALCLYAAIVRHLTRWRVALVATLGAAGLSLWGTPLLWISGSQDLWMLCLGLGSLYLFMRGRTWWSVVPFVPALLSKETAVVLPGVLAAYALVVERRRVAEALGRTAHFWLVVLTWLAVHPTLRVRLLSPQSATQELEHRPALPVIVARTLLATVNLDAVPRPSGLDAMETGRILVAATVLGVGLLVGLRRRSAGSDGDRRVAVFALVWAAAGWLPLVLPSIGWHAYYGCVGALGAWLLIALVLARRPRVAVAAITCLALVRGAQAATLSWDWGNEWYQRRAGSILASIRTELLRQHPSLPAHSRVFFGHIPNNIGLVAGQSPALRVWYRDGTLQAGFYSSYRPRTDSRGRDLFFRFDPEGGLIEVVAGPEDVPWARSRNPDWEDDHEKLALLFLQSGDVVGAAREFEKLSTLPHRVEAGGLAAVCWEVAGDSVRADSLLDAAARRLRLTPERRDRWAAGLRVSFPGRRPGRG